MLQQQTIPEEQINSGQPLIPADAKPVKNELLSINNNKKFIDVSAKITKYSGKLDERAEEFKK